MSVSKASKLAMMSSRRFAVEVARSDAVVWSSSVVCPPPREPWSSATRELRRTEIEKATNMRSLKGAASSRKSRTHTRFRDTRRALDVRRVCVCSRDSIQFAPKHPEVFKSAGGDEALEATEALSAILFVF